jgi:hypothetical protein
MGQSQNTQLCGLCGFYFLWKTIGHPKIGGIPASSRIQESQAGSVFRAQFQSCSDPMPEHIELE